MSKEVDEKFITYSDGDMEQLETLIGKYFASFQKQYAPALDLVLPATVSKHARKFLLEQKAVYLLDQEAIERGHASAAHEMAFIAKEKADKDAAEKAAQDAVEAAQRKKDQEILDAEVERQRVLKDLRDREDADNAAKLKAKLEAESKGQELTGL